MKYFDSVIVDNVNKNVFDLSHEKKLTGNMGELLPILCMEIIPGDTFEVKSEILTRFMPLLAPVMHRIDVYTHYFYVPNRIIDQYFEEFITDPEIQGGQNLRPLITIDDTTKASFVKGRLPDYLGIPPIGSGANVVRSIDISAHPFLAYANIWNEFYRDQNLQTELDLETYVDTLLSDSGDTTVIDLLTQLRFRAFEKDYFTSCLPWAQKGTPIPLPIGTSAPISYVVTGTTLLKDSTGGISTISHDAQPVLNVPGGGVAYLADGDYNPDIINIDNSSNLIADLSNATGVTLNDLRRAEAIQKWMEKNARGGNRYIETLLVHFGVRSSDARLHRPEYLGGGKNPVIISEVLQNSQSTEVSALGEMAGHGLSIGQSNGFKKYFEEHGWIIGLLSILPRTQYSQGINKSFLYESKEEMYWPSFSQLGEEQVKMDELYIDWETAQIEPYFGYQSRYAHLKHFSSNVAGDFRDSLEFWGCHRIFDEEPALNEEFIVANEDCLHRIFALESPDADKIVIQCFNNVKATRPIPYFNNPTL